MDALNEVMMVVVMVLVVVLDVGVHVGSMMMMNAMNLVKMWNVSMMVLIMEIIDLYLVYVLYFDKLVMA